MADIIMYFLPYVCIQPICRHSGLFKISAIIVGRMIYRLTVECIDGWHYDHETIRVIEIDENATLYDLFDIIRASNGFGFEHMHMFYLGRNPRNLKIIFTDDKELYDRECRSANSILRDIYPLGNLKFYFIYDFGDEWIFQIKKSRKRIELEANATYPRVIKRIGADPLDHLYQN